MLNDHATSDFVYKALFSVEEAPPHPGEILRDDIMPAAGLTRTALAKRLGVSIARLSNVLAERTPVTADLALRLGLLLGHGPRYWLGLQMQHDLWMTAQPPKFEIRPLEWKRAAMTATAKTSPTKKAAKKTNRRAGYR